MMVMKILQKLEVSIRKSGLFDLSGNLSEWVHNYYAVTFSINRKDPLSEKRVKSCN